LPQSAWSFAFPSPAFVTTSASSFTPSSSAAIGTDVCGPRKTPLEASILPSPQTWNGRARWRAKLAGGALADDPHRRRATAVGGYTTTAITSALIGVAAAVWQVAVLRIAAWAARGLRVPSRNALLADAAPPESYGRPYGFERAMDNFGAIIGPLLAIGLVSAVGVRTAILLSV
jgi:MFS family permease